MAFFIIKSIEVLEACDPKIRKNLKVGVYPFAGNLERGFFGQNMTVQVIVGMNGSGKSALLELMFRMINNFSAQLFRDVNCNAADRLVLVRGIHADLHYAVDNVEGVLSVRDMAVGLKYGEESYRIGELSELLFPEYRDSSFATAQDIRDIAGKFFYTVVTNYSLQAYLSNDYRDEHSMLFNQKIREWRAVSGKVWIDSLFHKNDGYMTSINLNPYRDHGVINMHTETQLTMYRVTALLIEYQRMGQDYISGYQLHTIKYKFRKEKLVSAFENLNKHESGTAKYKRILKDFRQACSPNNPESYANLILGNFQIDNTGIENADEMLVAARLYLVNKVLSIAASYPNYSRFLHLTDPANALLLHCERDKKGLVKTMAKKVKDDKSHISVKVWQAYYFIKRASCVADLSFLYKTFTYQDYEDNLALHNPEMSVYERLRILPPSFFTEEVMLERKKENKTKGQIIPLRKLSSGERQFLFTTSCVIYHLMNLRSVRKDRPKYRNYNVVLDEVEICFHPEYQRTFLRDLILLINRSGITDKCGINILMTTHSPFILSDIPQTNILYLEDGERKSREDFKKPFAANVNDILYQDFFMKKGFMGALAQQKILRLVKFLTSEEVTRESYDMELADRLIEKVGDPLLKSKLESLLKSFYGKHPELRDQQA